MKKTKLFYLFAILFACCLSVQASEPVTFDCKVGDGYNLSYEVNDDDTSVTCMGFAADAVIGEKDLEIPASVTHGGTSYTVIDIAYRAFYYKTALTGELILPNTLKVIGEEAFATSDSIKGITLPEGLITIGMRSFYGCKGLTGSLTIPNSVTAIASQAFSFCSNLSGTATIGKSVDGIGEGAFTMCGFSAFSVHADNAKFSSYNDMLYNKDQTRLLICPYAKASTFTFPSTMATIAAYAFNGCTELTGDLNIPNTVTRIEERAFYGCEGFDGTLTIPNSVTYIGKEAFAGCENLTGELNIPSSIDKIENGVFNACVSLTGELVIPNSISSIGESAFGYCLGFSSLTLGDAVDTIGDMAFVFCKGLTGDLNIPNSVKLIGDGAFGICTGLDGKINIGSSVDSISGSAFLGDTLVTAVVCHAASVPRIGDDVFGEMPAEDLNLFVPETSVASYSDDAKWNIFNSILPIEPLAVDEAKAPVPFKQMGDVLRFDTPTKISVYNISGQAVYTGVVNDYQLPNQRGIYMIQTKNKSNKVIK